MHRIVMLLALLVAAPSYSFECPAGKTVVIIEGGTSPVEFPGDVSATQYASGSGEIWETGVNLLKITGTNLACFVSGLLDGPLDPDNDAITFYECDEEHGHTGGPCLAYHGSGATNLAGVAPDNEAGTIIEGQRIFHVGDGISINTHDAGDLIVRDVWIRWAHDDAIEDDFRNHSVTVANSFLDTVNMAFAFDTRGSHEEDEQPPGRVWVLFNNLVDLHRFTNTYKGPERPGHGGLFKDDQQGVNPALHYLGQKVILGPVAGNQVYFPPPADTVECDGNIHLYDMTEDDYLDLLAFQTNEEDRDALALAFGADCITEIKRFEVCSSCEVDADGGSAEFRAMNFTALGNHSWNYLVQAWVTGHGYGNPPPPGCGIGPELLLVVPLLGLLWGRVRN